jgi:DNA-binding NarL/FixJ family response regulator
MIRVLICDDQELAREGLKTILGSDAEITVVGVAANGAEAVEMVAESRPDLVLMDLKMPVLNGVQATRLICRDYPQTRVLVLTTYDADEWVFDAIRSGAAGYLLKDSPRETLLAAIRDTMAGKTPVDPAVAGKLFRQVAGQRPIPASSLVDGLSEREKEVLGLLGRGLSNQEIAARLFLSEGTVKNYVSAILDKLEVTDRTQAAVLAIRYGMVGLDDLE